MQTSDKTSKGRPLYVVSVAVAMLFACQFLPWERMTGGIVSDFNLFEDLSEPLDVKRQEPSGGVNLAQEIAEAESEDMEVTTTMELPVREIEAEEHVTGDNVESYVPAYVTSNTFKSPRVDGEMVIEDYSPEGNALDHFKAALSDAGNRVVRIAVIGDSYIEGDLLCHDIRQKLRKQYGGAGVGYVAMHSDFPGFRRTVTQSDKGWTNSDIKTSKSSATKTLQGVTSHSVAGATASFKGVGSHDNLKTWSRSVFIYSSPVAGTVEIETRSGKQLFPVAPSETPETLEVEDETDFVSIATDIDSLVSYGLWLDGNTGISVDCMSIRGYSGIRHRSLSENIASELRQNIDYDLIIIEYGTNALSEEQTDYTSYSNVMCKSVNRIRQCYPDADIVMLGVGDRGVKHGTEIVSMPTVTAMTASQRLTAQKCGVAFWDVREAMGGEGSVVDWRNRGLVNSDYIHINGKGGEAIAEMFVKSLLKAVNE